MLLWLQCQIYFLTSSSLYKIICSELAPVCVSWTSWFRKMCVPGNGTTWELTVPISLVRHSWPYSWLYFAHSWLETCKQTITKKEIRAKFIKLCQICFRNTERAKIIFMLSCWNYMLAASKQQNKWFALFLIICQMWNLKPLILNTL